MSGSKSGNEKRNLIKTLLVGAKGHETRYIVRSLQGKLRIGLAAKVIPAILTMTALFLFFKKKKIVVGQSVLVAVVHAVVFTPPDSNFPPRILNRATEGR